MLIKEVQIVLVFIFIISIVATVMAINLNTIEPGTLESGNITFTQAGSDVTYYFNLSKNATIFSARMNVNK